MTLEKSPKRKKKTESPAPRKAKKEIITDKDEANTISPARKNSLLESKKIELTEDPDKGDMTVVEMRKVEFRKRLSWMCVCPHCSAPYSDLNSHIKQAHPGKESKGIRARCPVCDKLVVDIQNHIRQVHEKRKNFKCDECSSAFTNNHALEKHVQAVHRKVMIECPHCKLSVRINHLKTHISRVHENKKQQIKCEQCDKIYSSKSDMQRHVLNVHMKYKLKCEYCDKEITPELMTRHIKSKHQGIHKLYCKYCQQGFDYERSLQLHMSSHHSGIFFQCNMPILDSEGEFCKRKLASESALKEHIMNHLAKDYKVICTDCDEEIYSCYQEEHDLRCHPKHDSKISCDVDNCIAVVDSRDEMLGHLKEAHSNLMEYLEWCTSCRKPVVNLETHKTNFHKEINDREFTLLTKICIGVQCPEDGCKFFGLNQMSIDRHVKLTHKKSITSICDICNKSYRDVEKHKRDVHSEEKCHVCPTCGAAFQTKKKMRIHLRIHSKPKKECELCDAKVTNLKQHMDMVHSNIRPYSCDVEGCTTTFVSKFHKSKHVMHVHEGMRYKCGICHQEVTCIKSHMRFVHSKEKKHKCPECDKYFQTLSHMRTHVARVHLGVKMTCPECGKQVQDLRNHQYFIHRQHKNFPCDQCDKRFNTLTLLKLHLSFKHLSEK